MDIGDRELEILRAAFGWARAGSHLQLERFLAAGGPVNLTNGSGDTLLILAAYHSRLPAVTLLLDHHAELDRSNDNGQTALAAAVFRQHIEIVDLLLEAGADPDAGRRSARAVAQFFGLTEMLHHLPAPRPSQDPSPA